MSFHVFLSIESPIQIIPFFVQEPQGASVFLNSRVELVCMAQGQPIPLISWFKNGNPIPMQHESTYVIRSIQLTDRANYTCTAQNMIDNMLQTITSRQALVNIRGKLRDEIIVKNSVYL